VLTTRPRFWWVPKRQEVNYTRRNVNNVGGSGRDIFQYRTRVHSEIRLLVLRKVRKSRARVVDTIEGTRSGHLLSPPDLTNASVSIMISGSHTATTHCVINTLRSGAMKREPRKLLFVVMKEMTGKNGLQKGIFYWRWLHTDWVEWENRVHPDDSLLGYSAM
jgi:hypothetical protein